MSFEKDKEILAPVVAYVEEQTGYLIFLKDRGDGMLRTPGPRPVSLISMLLRELEAWRCAECLHDRFDVRFDEDVFDEGLGSYIIDLIASDERPSFEWLAQLIGE
jgi:hypothetical protein